MCGIAGFICRKYTKDILLEMTDGMKHRGPDAQGFFYDQEKGVGLGHRRLSIIDLTSAANQPMISNSGRYVMVYNGEVYNYKDIARELDVRLKTNSDSEVILEAFEKWGPDFVNRLNGMFAIAIFDVKENTLSLFRDRLGIKPLYYYVSDNCFAFASEIKAFKSCHLDHELNKQSISEYFYLGYSSQNSTIYKNLHQLPAGSFGNYSNGSFKIKAYWRIEDQIHEKTEDNYLSGIKKLKELLFSSVEYRLLSDVPVGTFLSGGIDSSLITAIATRLSDQKINTFSIGFAEAKFNESVQAKKIAAHLKTNHEEFIVSYDDALDVLDKVMKNFDQPFVDSSAIPTYLVSCLAKKKVSVALSGDGGDELFMGYGSYKWANRLSNPFYWRARKSISTALKLSNVDRNRRAAQVFNCPTKSKLKSHIFSQEQYLFSEVELQLLLKQPALIAVKENYQVNRILSINEEQSVFDIDNYLKDDLLVKVDRSSMLCGLEVRVPLLDHRIVEYSLNLNQSFKINSAGIQKHMLKDMLYEFAPKNLLNTRKWGFSIPLNSWLTKELRHLIDEYLDDELIRETGIFNANYIMQIKNRFINGENYLYNKIWQLIVFNKFLKDNGLI